MKVILFYKYAELSSPKKIAKEHLIFCKTLGIKGRILFSTEGINGSVSGNENQIQKYKDELCSYEDFKDIEFKEESCMTHPFKRMNIKIKPELVRFEQNVSYKDAGLHLSPEEFLETSKEEGVIILDARNEYESRVGKFKKAITTNIKTFREFPKILDLLEGKKDKKILMYCTGGIRCEKASAFLKKNGFGNVYQLHGGILNFEKECPDTIWEGKCFVFDKRMLSEIQSDKQMIRCDLCKEFSDLYRNCSNTNCDKLFISCIDCETNNAGCCSKECLNKKSKTIKN